MIVRSNRPLDLGMVLFVGILTAQSLKAATENPILWQNCSYRHAWFCDLMFSARTYEIFGLNPVLLSVAVILGVFVAYCARRFWTGWSAKMDGDIIRVPRLLGTSRVRVDEIREVEIKPKLFGLVATLNLTTYGNRRLSAANAKRLDAQQFADALRVRLPAPPATPPAT